MTLKAGELIFPNTDLRASGKFAGGEQVDDVPRADLGRPKVKCVEESLKRALDKVNFDASVKV